MNKRNLTSVAGYRPLVAARAISAIVLWLDFTLIFSLLSFQWRAEAMVVGLASALYGLPGLIVGPYLGSLADRSNPVHMLIGSYLARAITSGLLIFAPNVHIFVVLVLLKGLANVGAMPAEQVLIRSMLSREQAVENAGIMSAVDQLTKISAPLVAATMTGLFRPESGLWLSTILAFFGIGCLCWLLPCSHKVDATRRAAGKAGQFGALLALLRENIQFRFAFFSVVLLSAVLGLYDPLLTLFLRGQVMPASTFGLIVSCTAGGGLCGALIFRRVYVRHGQRLAATGLAGFGLTVLLPGILASQDVAIPASLLLVLWALNGCFYGLSAMSFGVAVQQQCPQEYIGNISAAARSVQLAALVLGPLLGASMAQRLGIPLVFVTSGSVAAIVGLLLVARSRQSPTHVSATSGSAEGP
ncbi:MFS transporter [Cupriavidus sp. TMH.W2]|uniref:MFS transporter n=1 Tax=Cupriavidus sp. TMH.W2 TaxID=3434465 RepID=UPI003D77D732